ncbi:helix-turn-helix domain-containing protein [Kluyvera sp. STS39-E]|uniref:helix-turn-helix domain-containing protein n=1 Tax=Kluyvera sp. STS39-E TaxID=3234748 RepID=UPI0034C64BED
MMKSQLPHLHESKPISEMTAIINAMEDKLIIRHGRKNKRIFLTIRGERQVLFLLNGHINVVRQWDLRTLANMRAPFVLGSGVPSVDEDNHFVIRAIDDIEYALLPMATFEKYLDDLNLWKPHATILTWMLMWYHLYHNMLAENDHGRTAHILLDALSHESELIRQNTTALSYIQDRTLFSRSWIMQFLADLKRSGKIELKRGILVKFNPSD